ncbi:hypothetical protein SAMN05421810_101348 [Amycolatopsis arida]|uniref:Uncharacterized protein n=1 Tax=Amycolatopsis arida TaxID=587909 RepID=A0A1I5KZB6_9PSEU|nr:DUF6098 family protein [Amycolatopsis arida]TDX85892.1 hypothetical protein CLV69_11473 [Amycolatopsis arida]SFO90450.1 hypothetical protein SAMN05421810_101348 [Amycolatopsis arida]
MFTVHDLAELAELTSLGVAPYLRYSPGPESDARHPSRDHESGLLMPGLSVNPLPAPGWWSLPLEDWLARRVCQYLRELREGARPWLLNGRQVDFGPDNEPLVVDITPVAWVSPALLDQAQRHYHQRLNAGESTH